MTTCTSSGPLRLHGEPLSAAGRLERISSSGNDKSSALASIVLTNSPLVPDVGNDRALRGGRFVIMSIHPRYVTQILDGTKRVELRKRPLADDVSHIVMYATAPISAVVGAFSVSGQMTLTTQALWRKFRGVGGIAWRDFRAYYEGKCLGTGIEIGQVLKTEAPMDLLDHFGIRHPPQSFQYLSTVAAGRALDAMTPI